tara:strand:+ start:79 stop:330 length:252 start_codon:yes stop_codon:yes gene_type:complete
MASRQLPGISSVDFSEALRLAAARKTRAEEERKRKEAEKRALIMKAVNPLLSMAATAYGGPVAGSVVSAALPVAAKALGSLGR